MPQFLSTCLKRLSLLTSLTIALSSTGFAQPDRVAIVHAGKLLPVPGSPVLEEQSLVIVNGRVREIFAGYIDQPDAEQLRADAITTYDLKDMFVLPGLIDGHVHLTMEFGPRFRLDAVELSDSDRAIQGAYFAEKTLMAGFTTVRDVGAWSADAIFAVRDGIAKGQIVGPRVFAAGAIISITGGHGDGAHGYRADIAESMMQPGLCDGVGDCRRAVREQVRRTADHIKLTATAGVMSNTLAGLEQQLFDDEIEAIVDTAHLMGRRVTAHAHGVNGVNAALRAGVDSIEHGTYLNEQSIRLFKKTGAYLVPTMLPGEQARKWAADPRSNLTEAQRRKSEAVGPLIVDMVRRAHEGGVDISFGTDAGVYPHGENGREFALLVSAGLSAMEAIKAATVNGAANIGQAESLGTLEPGKFADLVAVDGDPLADISELEDIDFVMKEGVVYKSPRGRQ